MSTWDYFADLNGKTPTLRRYRPGSEHGERWENGAWVAQCAPRTACLLTHDKPLSEVGAEEVFPGSTATPPQAQEAA